MQSIDQSSLRLLYFLIAATCKCS